MSPAQFYILSTNRLVAAACLALVAPIIGWTTAVPFVEDEIVTVSGEISLDLGRYAELQGNIEYLACSHGGKSYESLLVLDVEPGALRQALLATGIEAGSPASMDSSGNVVPPDGPGVTVTVSWEDPNGQIVRVRAEELIRDVKTDQAMERVEWIFTGSRVLEDPATGDMVFQADLTGNIISTHQADRSVLLQNPLAEAIDGSRYKPNDAVLPGRGTPVELSLDVSGPIARSLLIHGAVQGVGFRAFARNAADLLGVVGYVRNLDDGGVEVAAEGRPTVIHELVRRLKHGPPHSRVDALEMGQIPVSGEYPDFRIFH